MKIKINPQTDPYLHFIDGWQIFRTTSEDRSFYLIKDQKLILILGEVHNEVLSLALQSDVQRIRYDFIDEIELLSVLLPKDQLLIFTNVEVHEELARILPAHHGGMSILTPGDIHQSGCEPTKVEALHPSGKCFDVFTLDKFEAGGEMHR